jgi:hypothetical protein
VACLAAMASRSARICIAQHAQRSGVELSVIARLGAAPVQLGRQAWTGVRLQAVHGIDTADNSASMYKR